MVPLIFFCTETGVGDSRFISPNRQLLSETAVVGVGAIPVLQPFRSHEPDETAPHVVEARLPAGEEVGEQLPLRRGLRMEGEIRVVGGDAVFSFEFANAPGAQVAPGSHEVGEDFQDGGIGHG